MSAQKSTDIVITRAAQVVCLEILQLKQIVDKNYHF